MSIPTQTSDGTVPESQQTLTQRPTNHEVGQALSTLGWFYRQGNVQAHADGSLNVIVAKSTGNAERLSKGMTGEVVVEPHVLGSVRCTRYRGTLPGGLKLVVLESLAE